MDVPSHWGVRPHLKQGRNRKEKDFAGAIGDDKNNNNGPTTILALSMMGLKNDSWKGHHAKQLFLLLHNWKGDN